MKIFGVKASPGIEISTALRLDPLDLSFKAREHIIIDQEMVSFNQAIEKSKGEISKLKVLAEEKIGAELAQIFDAHLLILEDPELTSSIHAKISGGTCAEIATLEVRETFVNIFRSMSDPYMQERASDVFDVTNRVIAHLTNQPIIDLASLDKEVIIVAHDLTPSETAQLNRLYVKGFVTNVGGRTSHSAIMARIMEIPAVTGTNVGTTGINTGDEIIIDGLEGNVIVSPTDEEKAHYQKLREAYVEKQNKLKMYKDLESLTKDGHKVELAANIGTPEDIEGVLKVGADGVGLFRTEFLYMNNNDFPTEEEQYQAYKSVLEKAENRPVVVRTLDIGGDKNLEYFSLPKELNPFLGQRAVRLCLANKYLFVVQLRALLRASVHGNLKIMFPMIALPQEFIEAKEILLECKADLLGEGYEVSENIEIGIMIEIPSAAVMADKFAKIVDFFSIGTNDLIQYTMAADRMNEAVSYLYQPYSPAVLRLIKHVIDSAHKEGIWTGMCGEMGGDLQAIPLLIGLGLDEFSMSAPSVLAARELISKLDRNEMKELAIKAIDMFDTNEVIELVKSINID